MSAALKSSKPATRVLVIDDAPFCRELTAAALAGQGFAVQTAEGGTQALQLLRQNPVDLIILDYEMPNMGGFEFLKAIRADARWKSLPVVMLTNNSSTEAVTQAARYGVRGYMIKSRFSLPTLMKRVEAALASPAGPQPVPAAVPAISSKVGREKTLAAVAELAGAKTLSGVVAELLAIANSPQSNLSDLSGILRRDPVMAARVLQVAGSPAHAASKQRLTNVDDAVRILGAAGVRDIALSAGIFHAFAGDEPQGMELLRCWQHAFATAAIMRRIVPRSDNMPGDLPYLAGLCHDLGEMMLRQHFPSEFAEVESGAPLQSIFGVTCAELAEEFFRRVQLPPLIGAAIREYAHLSAGKETENVIARALLIADQCAHGLLMTPSAQSLVSPVLGATCRRWTLSPAQINGAEVRAEAITTTCILAKVTSQKQQALMRPLLPSAGARIGYVRHSAFAALDPLGLALQSLSSVELFDRPPRGEEAAGLQGVIVAGAGPESSHATPTTGELPPLKLSPPNGPDPSLPVSLSRLAQFLQSVHK